MTLNPSLGAGLEVCTPAQLAAESRPSPRRGRLPQRLEDRRLQRPRALLRQGVLKGAIYLAPPRTRTPSTPCSRVYLSPSQPTAASCPLPGKLTPDPGDGTLTATFDDLPQLPYTDLEVNFRSGQRAPLISPPSCGHGHRRKIALTPWAAGAAPTQLQKRLADRHRDRRRPLPDAAQPRPSPPARWPAESTPTSAPTPPTSSTSSAKTPSRRSPPTRWSCRRGSPANWPASPSAPSRRSRRPATGAASTRSPTPPARPRARSGAPSTGYGVGPALTYAPGRIYLAGPYHGSPLSLVTINAATVGPFDLGTIVIRSAFDVDPRTAQLQIDSSASDPIPHIIDGIPLHLRDVRIYMDRLQFTHNPSSCEPSPARSPP